MEGKTSIRHKIYNVQELVILCKLGLGQVSEGDE